MLFCNALLLLAFSPFYSSFFPLSSFAFSEWSASHSVRSSAMWSPASVVPAVIIPCTAPCVIFAATEDCRRTLVELRWLWKKAFILSMRCGFAGSRWRFSSIGMRMWGWVSDGKMLMPWSGKGKTNGCNLVSRDSWLGTGIATVDAMASMAHTMTDRIGAISERGENFSSGLLQKPGSLVGWTEISLAYGIIPWACQPLTKYSGFFACIGCKWSFRSARWIGIRRRLQSCW